MMAARVIVVAIPALMSMPRRTVQVGQLARNRKNRHVGHKQVEMAYEHEVGLLALLSFTRTPYAALKL